MVAMIKSHEPKTLYIAPYGTDTPRDYQPIYALHLETGEEIAGSFEADAQRAIPSLGVVPPTSPSADLALSSAGVALVVHKDAPDTISLSARTPVRQRNLFRREPSHAKDEAGETARRRVSEQVLPLPRVQPIYIACVHVAHGEKEPMILNRPTTTQAGLAFCSDECNEEYDHEIDRRGGRQGTITAHPCCMCWAFERSPGRQAGAFPPTGRSKQQARSSVVAQHTRPRDRGQRGRRRRNT